MSKVLYYRAGHDRNNERALSHTYAETAAGKLWPMCGYGWNRSNGKGFSILRGAPGTEGDCLLCRKAVAEGKRPTTRGITHKTRWL